ncbi:MAG: MATE family efflux transporter [Lachnospiraceae bacterium]|nr:MATE family efflux transporter [Lachnospiraceae bacterium]
MQQTDFTRGSITKALLPFFFSMLLANILQQFYSFADMAIIGKGLGDTAVAAVGNFTTLSFLITGFAMGLANGFSVNISQAYGEKDFAALRKAAAASVKLSVLFAVFLTGIGLGVLKPVLRLMKTEQMLMEDCLSYGYVIFGGLLITILYNLLSAMLRAVGDSRTPLLAVGAASCVNIGLDFLCLFVFDTGVAGAAWATILAQFVSVLICCDRLYKIREFRIERSDFVFGRKLEPELLRNGMPMARMNAITSLGCIFVQSRINSYGVIYTSAYSVCNKYLNLFMLPGITIGFVVSAFSGQNFGAVKFERIRSGTKIADLMALFSSLLLGIILFFSAGPLARLMLAEQEAIGYTIIYLRFLALFLILLNLLFVFRSCVQGMGKPGIPMCSGLAEMAIRILVIILGLPVVGFTAAIYAEGMAWFGALMLNLFAYLFYIRPHTDT